MSGRGGEMIVALVALEAGVFSGPAPVTPEIASMFSSGVIMALTTSIVAPLGLRFLLHTPEMNKA